MKSDRHVFLFPSLAIPVDEGWQIEVHAWCCRLRSHRVAIPLVRKALGFERARLSAMEKQTFAERARWMFADNTRGHLSLQPGQQCALEEIEQVLLADLIW